MHTRKTTASSSKQTPPPNTTPVRQRGASATKTPSNADPVPDDPDVTDLLASLSKESKTLVKILQTIITKQFHSEIQILKDEISKRDAVIDKLDNEVKDLKVKVTNLETHIDRVEQYERRDTVIISGPSLPPETLSENVSNVVTESIKEHLKLNLKPEDISVAHRLGTTQPGRDRPVIVKFVNRSLKYETMGACIQLRPRLYINESLTPKRLDIFKQVLAIRKQHREKFQQCFTKDGNIVVKLKHSTVKHVIVDDQSFMALLDKYPYMKDTYTSLGQ